MNRKISIQNLTRASLFVALITIGAYIKVPIPNLPFTLQFLFTNLAGIILGGFLGASSVAIYVLLGLIGLPVFTSGGGPAYIFMPSFGYLLGFILGAYVGGKFIENNSITFKNLLIASLINLAVVYILGMAYFYFISNFYLGKPIDLKSLFIYCFLLAIPGDLFLSIASAVVGEKVLKAFNFKYLRS